MVVQEMHHILENVCVSRLVTVCTLVNFAIKKVWCSNILCGGLKIAPAKQFKIYYSLHSTVISN